MLWDKTASFLRLKNEKHARQRENMSILQDFITTEVLSKKSHVFRLCLICRSCKTYKGTPLCQACIKKYFLKTESFVEPSICDLYDVMRTNSESMPFLEAIEKKSREITDKDADMPRCIHFMYINMSRLVQLTVQRRIAEKRHRERAKILLTHYHMMKKAYMKALFSTDWDPLFVLKDMLSQILASSVSGL